ncbi:hypothetical protein COOONC_03429 [Cooperia oncophora]
MFILCGPGESRRIKAFKWFCKYFDVPAGPERSLSCKGMLDNFDAVQHNYSWQPDWGNMWRSRPCDCEPAPYGGKLYCYFCTSGTFTTQLSLIKFLLQLMFFTGPLPYYDPKVYPSKFAKENDRNRLRCVYSIYDSPSTFRLDEGDVTFKGID